jgi:LacI family transcriptional regulator
VGVIDARKRDSKPKYRLGFLLQQSTRELYQVFAQKIRDACTQRKDAQIEAVIEFADNLEPESIAARLSALGRKCDCVAVIAADHPLVSQAIQALKAEGKPVVAYITDQSAPGRAGFVGTDNWKLGRTAAWFIAKTTAGPGRVVVFIGNYRYQCQDIADASFRSYIRENASRLTVGDSLPTHEEPNEAYRIVSGLLSSMDDLIGIFIVGGGISGVLRALREAPEKARFVSLVCRDIGPETQKGLAEGLITAALCHPLKETSSQLVQTMIDTIGQAANGVILQRLIPFEIITPESVS